MKKVLSILLSAAMLCGLLTVNAFAAPAEFEYGAIGITLSDTISKEADCYAGPIYKVNAGTTVTAKSKAYNLGEPWVSFGSCDWNSDHTELIPNGVSIYEEGCDVREEDGYKYATFTVDKPGLWEIVMMDNLFFTTHCAIYLEVVGEETAEPVAPVEPEQPAQTVAPSNCPVSLNGKAIDLNAYLFMDENGGGTNYVMLRDVATILNDTAARFEVSWSAEAGITLTKGQPYTPVGGEMASKGTEAKAYIPNASTITVDGATVELEAYTIEENNYFKLRDLGEVLGFGVDWDAAAGAVVLTAAYDPREETENESLPAALATCEANISYAELGTTYDYHSVGWDDKNVQQVNDVTFENYRVIESDATHSAREGYEWQIVQVALAFNDPTVAQVGYGFTASVLDYYSGVELDEGPFTVNYNGTNYECERVRTKLEETWHSNNTQALLRYEYAVRVPVGYDGVVVSVCELFSQADVDDILETSGIADFAGKSLIGFRMGK